MTRPYFKGQRHMPLSKVDKKKFDDNFDQIVWNNNSSPLFCKKCNYNLSEEEEKNIKENVKCPKCESKLNSTSSTK